MKKQKKKIILSPNKFIYMEKQSTTDSFLLSAMQRGDRNAFDTLFRKYYIPLRTYAARFVGTEDAHEIVQDIMLLLWEKRDTLHINYSFNQYIFKAVYHRSMDQIAHNEIAQHVHTTYAQRIYVQRTQAMLEETDACQLNELSRRLREALNELPESYRESFVMHRFKHMNYKEIADLLEVSPKTVAYRIQQALKLLRIKLKDYLPLLLLINNNQPFSFFQ